MANQQPATGDGIPFYPDHVRTELGLACGLVLAVLIVGWLGLANPVGLGPPADPMDTPAHIKPEWYFLALYQVLKFVPKTVGALVPVVGFAALVLWPFVDGKPDASPSARRRRFAIAAVGLVITIALTVWGELG